MKRELANKMYTPTAYFFGRFISNILIQVAMPVVLVLIMFWGLDIQETGDNFW